MLYPVIMAGGAGTRFWPESRGDRPKQLLSLVGGPTLIQQAASRAAAVAAADRTLVVTAARLLPAMVEQLPGIPPSSIIGEPCKRDTAPCIGLAALMLAKRDPAAVMLVMPADHVIRDQEAFARAVRAAEQLVAEAPQRIVTFGIRPSYPAESFGYIERGAPLPLENSGDIRAYQVKQFREKPKGLVAEKYVAAGTFFWNSGIFVWQAATIVAALRQHEPEMVAHLEKIVAAQSAADASAVMEREFTAIRGVSIDYAVMEKAKDVAVVEAPFDWDDVGSWQAVARLAGADASGNTVQGLHVGLDTKGTIVRSTGDHLVVTLGVNDLIVVHTPGATLVANKHDEEAIRQVVKQIEAAGLGRYL